MMTETQEIKSLLKDAVQNGLDYSSYREKINYLLKQNKTSGNTQSEEYIQYTKLNVQRMKRLDKTVTLSPEFLHLLENLQKDYQLVVITEAWCGDAAHAMPIIAKMAEATDKIDLKIVFRDENLELIENFQTNGANSIPKLIAVEENCEVLGTWGPKPETAKKKLEAFKENPKAMSKEEYQKDLQLWYSKDKGKSIMDELLSLMHHWDAKKVAVPCPETH